MKLKLLILLSLFFTHNLFSFSDCTVQSENNSLEKQYFDSIDISGNWFLESSNVAVSFQSSLNSSNHLAMNIDGVADPVIFKSIGINRYITVEKFGHYDEAILEVIDINTAKFSLKGKKKILSGIVELLKDELVFKRKAPIEMIEEVNLVKNDKPKIRNKYSIDDTIIDGYNEVEYEDGSRYEGHFLNGLKHGNGSMFNLPGEGYAYVGNWRKGKWSGEGTLYIGKTGQSEHPSPI